MRVLPIQKRPRVPESRGLSAFAIPGAARIVYLKERPLEPSYVTSHATSAVGMLVALGSGFNPH